MNFKIMTVLNSAAGDLPFWKELWYAFFDTYIDDQTVYENLEFSSGSIISLRYIIIGLFIGLSLASFGAVFNKRVLGSFVRRLLKEECLSPDGAKNLSELGFSGNFFIRYGVTRGVTLRRVVRCREEEKYLNELLKKQEEYEAKRAEDPSLPKASKMFKEKPFRVNPQKHHFYIPEEFKYMADVKFEQKGTTWLGAILFTVIMLVALVVVLMALPYILELLNDFVGAFGASSASDSVLT